MACSQIELNKLGKIVANQKKLHIEDMLDSYEKHLKSILSKIPTRSRHANVLRRMYGHFNKKIPKTEQKTIEHLISEYQKDNITLSDVLHKLRTITFDIDNMYVVKQSYFLLFVNKI
ncbi:MAG: DUF1722 domain-containing protein [Candidatus Nitrosopumilus sp. bin_7KS]